jgi:hypothetical protein
MVLSSVADCHCFDADPDPDSTFRCDADHDPDPNPTQVLPKLKIRFKKKTLITSSASLHCFISLLSHRCHNFQNFGQYCEIFWKGARYYLASHLVEMGTVRIRISPNDADSPGSGSTHDH